MTSSDGGGVQRLPISRQNLTDNLYNKARELGAVSYETKDGITIFYDKDGVVKGNQKGYDNNGTIFGGSTATSTGTGTGDVSTMLAGSGTQSAGYDLAMQWLGGSYQIDPGTFMNASAGLYAGISTGAGAGFFGQLFNGFMSSLGFNFGTSSVNFSSSQTQSTPTQSTSTTSTSTRTTSAGTPKAYAGFVYVDGVYKKDNVEYKEDAMGHLIRTDGKGALPEGAALVGGKQNVYSKGDGKYYTYDGNSYQYLECDSTGKPTVPAGYTAVEGKTGIFTKDGKYYCYNDASSETLVECDANGNAKATTSTDAKPSFQGWKGTKPAIFTEDAKVVETLTTLQKAGTGAASKCAELVLQELGITANKQQIANLAEAIIARNPSVFAKDGDNKGALAAGVAYFDKLNLPDKDWINSNIVVQQSSTTSTTGTTGTTGARKSPDGWYQASGDKNSSISSLTVDTINANKGNNSAAKYIFSLFSGKVPSGVNQDAILDMFIKKNPSIFKPNGDLKDGVRSLEKLDIPSIDWMNANATNINQARTTFSRGANGYYVTIESGKTKYFDASGKEITGEEFKSKCPTIYSQATARTVKGNNGYSAVKNANGTCTYFDASGKEITGEEFKSNCPTIYSNMNK